MSLLIFKKEDKRLLSPWLAYKEYQCGCLSPECVYQLIDERLVTAFDKTRRELGNSVNVNSGFRCQSHNKNVGGLPNSYHTLGSAIDMSAESLSKLVFIAGKYFDKIKVYGTFVHGQIRVSYDKYLG